MASPYSPAFLPAAYDDAHLAETAAEGAANFRRELEAARRAADFVAARTGRLRAALCPDREAAPAAPAGLGRSVGRLRLKRLRRGFEMPATPTRAAPLPLTPESSPERRAERRAFNAGIRERRRDEADRAAEAARRRDQERQRRREEAARRSGAARRRERVRAEGRAAELERLWLLAAGELEAFGAGDAESAARRAEHELLGRLRTKAPQKSEETWASISVAPLRARLLELLPPLISNGADAYFSRILGASARDLASVRRTAVRLARPYPDMPEFFKLDFEAKLANRRGYEGSPRGSRPHRCGDEAEARYWRENGFGPVAAVVACLGGQALVLPRDSAEPRVLTESEARSHAVAWAAYESHYAASDRELAAAVRRVKEQCNRALEPYEPEEISSESEMDE